MSPELHADVVSLAFLLGTWRGEGTGMYPTIEPFDYTETLTFDHVGDAWLSYLQESWSPEGEPLHFERGFVRPGASTGRRRSARSIPRSHPKRPRRRP